MARRSRKELDEKLEELAEKLQTRVVEPGEDLSGLYIHMDPMMRGYSIYRKIPNKNLPGTNSWQVLGNSPESITDLYKKIDQALTLIRDFGLVVAHP